jgi:Zn-dependent peptidase ImmA (M78 family)
MGAIDRIASMARRFQVSRQAMEFRLDKLGLLEDMAYWRNAIKELAELKSFPSNR